MEEISSGLKVLLSFLYWTAGGKSEYTGVTSQCGDKPVCMRTGGKDECERKAVVAKQSVCVIAW
jgi:hypothetical protein